MTDQTQANQSQSGSGMTGGDQSSNQGTQGNMQPGSQSQGADTSNHQPQVNFPTGTSISQSSQSPQPQQASQAQEEGAIFPQPPQPQSATGYQGTFQGSTPVQQGGGFAGPQQTPQGGFQQPQPGYQGAYTPPAGGFQNPQTQPGTYPQTQPQGAYPLQQGTYAPPPLPVQGAGFQQPFPGGGQQPQGGTAQQDPPVDPSLVGYIFGEMNKNFKMNVKIPAHSLKFDEFYFLKLLAGSISLTKDEKWKIVQSVPKLRQEQVDELIRILEEEKEKFIELSPKHAAQLKRLEEQHLADWKDLEVREKQKAKQEQDEAKAAEIRKSLGLT